MIQKGSKALGMAKPKENQRPMDDKNIYKLNMTPIFTIFISTITSMKENTMELQKYEFSPQEH